MKLLKAKQVRQATAFKRFLFVALGGNFNKEMRRCSCNGLCQCRGAASGKERATDLGSPYRGSPYRGSAARQNEVGLAARAAASCRAPAPAPPSCIAIAMRSMQPLLSLRLCKKNATAVAVCKPVP